VIGDAVNTASRLCVAAGANEILISEAFYQALRQLARGRCQETVEVKGKANRLRVYRLRRQGCHTPLP